MPASYLPDTWFANHKYNKAKKYYNEGVQLAQSGDYNRAIDTYRKAFEYYTDNALQHYLYCGLAASYQALGYTDYALKCYNDAIIRDPHAFSCYYERAKILEAQGKHIAAVEDFNNALRIGLNSGENPLTFVDYFHQRGIALYNYGAYDKAAADFETALKYDPRHPNSHYYLGLAYSAQKKYPDALEEHNTVFKQNPTSIYPCDYYARGTDYLKNNMPYEAAQDFYRLTQLEQNTKGSALASYYLGKLHEEGKGVAKNGATATQYYVRAFSYLKDHQDDVWSTYTLAKMYQHGRGVQQDTKKAYCMMKALDERADDPLLRSLITKHIKQLDDCFEIVKIHRPGINMPPVANRAMPNDPSYYGSGAYSNGNPNAFYYSNGTQQAVNPQQAAQAQPVQEETKKHHFSFRHPLRY